MSAAVTKKAKTITSMKKEYILINEVDDVVIIIDIT